MKLSEVDSSLTLSYGPCTGKLLATTRINFYDSDDVSKRKLLAFGSHTKAVNKAWENAGGVSGARICDEADMI